MVILDHFFHCVAWNALTPPFLDVNSRGREEERRGREEDDEEVQINVRRKVGIIFHFDE
jgi:hypothetical protein